MIVKNKQLDDMGLIDPLAKLVGVPPAALSLLISVLLGYPLAYIYRTYVHANQSKRVCQLFLTITGILLCTFNYGFAIYHSLLAVLASYCFITFLPRSTLLVPVTFVFHMGYILIGYYFTTTEHYDITWTMPHCVLVLRLIGLSFDVADAAVPDEKQSKDMKRLRIEDKPDLLEIATFTYFPATMLVGPQFPLERLRRFLNHEFDQYTGYKSYGIQRFGHGVLYLAMNQVFARYVPDEYILSDEFANKAFLVQVFQIGVWGKTVIYKYVSCWMLAEGSAILFGLTFAGKNDNGDEDWTACTNIKITLYEFGRNFGQYIQAFNIQTNFWVAHYVYKRLKFLGNKHASHLLALFFLAVWHGFHSGYYMTFFMEFAFVVFEKNIEAVIYRNDAAQKFLEQPIVNTLLWGIQNCYVVAFGGWNLVPFVFLSFGKWWQVYKTLNYFGFIVFPMAFLAGPVLKVLLPPSTRTTPRSQNETKKLE